MFLEKFSLESGGAAYNLEIGFEPDTVEVWNYTKWESDGIVTKSYWHKGMLTAYALNEICDDTGTNRSISTSNGFTVGDGASFATKASAISGITAATPPVVTVAATSFMTTGDTVRLHGVDGMTEVNGISYLITVINSTTFSLQDKNGDNIVGAGFNAYSASGNDFANDLSIEQTATGSYYITLGTDVVGSDSDVLYVEARQADKMTAKGDIG